jgi:glycerophosphoryl diester phosphodiesterase
MLIIGHRGSQGTKHENTIASLREAMHANADMIEFDVRLTRDKIPVLSHNLHLYGTRKRELALLRRYTLAQLQERTGTSDHPITTLEDVMRECYGRIYLNIEVKEASAVAPTLDVIAHYARKKSDWDSILLSSFKPIALLAIRKREPTVALGMLHHRNPLAFVGWHKLLKLSAVGFNRLYVNTVALEVAKQLGLFTYAYTVNRTEAAIMLGDKGVDGIVTDYPQKMLAELDERR